jgi:hypothetical protein
MRVLNFTQKVRQDGSYFLKVDTSPAETNDSPEDAIESLVVQKLLAASTKLAFTELGSHPLDVGASIEVSVHKEGSNIEGKLVRYHEGFELGEPVTFDAYESVDIPVANRTTTNKQAEDGVSVIGSLNIFGGSQPTEEEVLEGVDVLVLDNAVVSIRVNADDASEVIGGFGTPSVLAAWGSLQLFRESFEMHASDVECEEVFEDDEDNDWDNEEDFENEFNHSHFDY